MREQAHEHKGMSAREWMECGSMKARLLQCFSLMSVLAMGRAGYKLLEVHCCTTDGDKAPGPCTHSVPSWHGSITAQHAL
eukprot:scaffold153732_cov17-Tisochrysis_lutea.AAC.1